MSLVLFEVHGPVCTISLNRPEKHNAIDQALLRTLDDAIARADRDAGIRAVVVRGAGGKAFSAGGDLKAFAALRQPEIAGWITLGNRVFSRLESLPKPTIAAIHGFAYGGGLELALACDFRLVSPAAKFSSPEVIQGWTPGWGGMMRLRRLLGEAHAKQIVFLGDVIEAQEALRIGLVTRVVPAKHFATEVQQFAERLARLEPEAFAAAKKALAGWAESVTAEDIRFQTSATEQRRRSASPCGK